jgi:hypothetical protein
MNQFFTAIFVLTLLFAGLMVYYILKSYSTGRKKKQEGEQVFTKIYEDEKIYVRNRLKKLLEEMREERILWLLIFSNLFPEDQIQITYSTLDGEIKILQHSRSLTDEEQERLRNLGNSSYTLHHGGTLLSTVPNSKIITDLVYFILEKVFNQVRAHNIKIKVSGG